MQREIKQVIETQEQLLASHSIKESYENAIEEIKGEVFHLALDD